MYCKYLSRDGNEWVHGFEVYDSGMKLLSRTEVLRSPERMMIEIAVQDEKNVYLHIFGGNGAEHYYKYVPQDGGYAAREYDRPISEAFGFSPEHPRTAPEIPYFMVQTTDDGQESSSLSLTRSGNYDENYSLKIQAEGFVCPFFQHHSWSIVTDYAGDMLLRSGEKEKSGFGCWYVSKEEIRRALYGE